MGQHIVVLNNDLSYYGILKSNAFFKKYEKCHGIIKMGMRLRPAATAPPLLRWRCITKWRRIACAPHEDRVGSKVGAAVRARS